MSTSKAFPNEWTMEGLRGFLKGKSPMAAAFEISIAHLSKAVSVTSDEETITGAFLGSLMANYPWCVINSDLAEVGTTCSWASYSKSGHDSKSESSSGADFALVLRKSAVVMVAVFQAKKALRKPGDAYAVNIYRKKDEKELVDVEHGGVKRKKWVNKGIQTAQIDSLLETGRLLEEKAMHSVVREAKPNSWVHYLGYKKDGVSCLHLSEVPDEKIQRARDGTEAQCDVELTASNSESWDKVLRDGLNNDTSPHWLPMTFEAAKKYLPELLPLMSVVIVDEGKGEAALRFSVEASDVLETVVNRRGEKLRKPMKEAVAAVFGLGPDKHHGKNTANLSGFSNAVSRLMNRRSKGGDGRK